MVSPVSSITRAATRKINEPLNILTFPTHERYESMMAKCGHNFYAYRAEGIKDWNTTYAPIPENYFLLDPELGESQIPDYVDFDVVLSQNKFGQLSIAKLNLRRQADDIGKAEEQTKKDFEDLQNKEREIVKEFTKKYGEGSLDPKTGVFTPSAKEENSN